MRDHQRGPWYDSDDPDRLARHGIPRVWVWVIATFVVFVLVGAGFWAFRTLTAPVRGQGDAYQQQQSGQNRTRAQEAFHSRIEDIRATDAKLDVLAAAVTADPQDRTARQTLTGTQSYCLAAVGEYDAEARKYNSREFRDADLPDRIDRTDPATDCKPSKEPK